MTRAELIMEFVTRFSFQSYLEVGVSKGATFSEVGCTSKIAVDPSFQFDTELYQREHPNSIFYSETSDAFFAEHAKYHAPYDVIFLDGLHTAEQIIRDFLNAILLLAPSGIIIVDDIRPNSYASSLPDLTRSVAVKRALGDNDASWMGDVYTLVPFISTFAQSFTYACPTEIRNCLVVWRAERPAKEILPRSLLQIANFSFAELVLDPTIYHDLPCEEIIRRFAVGRHPEVH